MTTCRCAIEVSSSHSPVGIADLWARSPKLGVRLALIRIIKVFHALDFRNASVYRTSGQSSRAEAIACSRFRGYLGRNSLDGRDGGWASFLRRPINPSLGRPSG